MKKAEEEASLKLGWLNPSIETKNSGDDIIAAAIAREISELGAESVLELPTRRRWTKPEISAAKACQLFIVGGTNLLTAHPLSYRQWVLGSTELGILRHRTVLLGAGWWQYQTAPDLLSRSLINWVLHPALPHSVRDSYTAHQLARTRRLVLNTSCPTLWYAPRSGTVGHGFRGAIVATVTDYHRDPKADREMLTVLARRGRSLTIWPQGSDDGKYVRSLGFGDYLLPTGHDAFERTLQVPDTGYVGTRLHAGIRALQMGVPSVIVAIDNRAAEIARDTNIATVARTDSTLDERLDRVDSWRLRIPDGAIAAWKFILNGAVTRAIKI